MAPFHSLPFSTNYNTYYMPGTNLPGWEYSGVSRSGKSLAFFGAYALTGKVEGGDNQIGK